MYVYPAHADDLATIERVRKTLVDRRKIHGTVMPEIPGKGNFNRDFIHRMESPQRDSSKLSSLQRWAAGLGCRLEFGVHQLWLFAHPHQEAHMWYAMSRAWGADEAMRMWLIAALDQWRLRSGVDDEVLAAGMGVQVETVHDFFARATDPVLKHVMLMARQMGTHITVDVWVEDEWKFG